MKSANDVQPDIISFNATISACEKSSEWHRALCLFEMMQQVTRSLGNLG